MKRITAFLVVALLALVFASSAMAQSATEDAYGGTPHVDGAGSLPFTGLNLAIVAIAGVALVGTGLAVRRASRSNLQA